MTNPASNDNRSPARFSSNARDHAWAETLIRVLVRRALAADVALRETEACNSRERAA